MRGTSTPAHCWSHNTYCGFRIYFCNLKISLYVNLVHHNKGNNSITKTTARIVNLGITCLLVQVKMYTNQNVLKNDLM